MTTFERIKKIAKEKGYSLTKLNDEAGLGKGTIYNWKKINPTGDNLQKVAKVLGVSTDLLLGNDNESKKYEVDLADDNAIFTYEGRQIPKRDLQIIKNMIEAMKKQDD